MCLWFLVTESKSYFFILLVTCISLKVLFIVPNM